MRRLIFVTHPEVVVDPDIPIENWSLSPVGLARAERFSHTTTLKGVAQLWSSAERKAQDAAAILSDALGIAAQTLPDLGENDRSATGFLAPDLFEAAADAFFARPDDSFRGWETARAAQARIVRTVTGIATASSTGDIAIVSHGAVGTLLYCHCRGVAIDRAYDQPHQGHYWIADLPALSPQHGWRSIG